MHQRHVAVTRKDTDRSSMIYIHYLLTQQQCQYAGYKQHKVRHDSQSCLNSERSNEYEGSDEVLAVKKNETTANLLLEPICQDRSFILSNRMNLNILVNTKHNNMMLTHRLNNIHSVVVLEVHNVDSSILAIFSNTSYWTLISWTSSSILYS